MGHSHTCLLYHVICGTKRRLPTIKPEVRERLDAYIGGILRAEQCSLLAAGGMPDHSHWLIRFHPSRPVSRVLEVFKSRSSGWASDTIEELRGFKWQGGYSAFTVSQSNVDEVKAYIARQEEHHRTMTFEEEYVAFLKKHGVEYDPRYLWAEDDE